MKRLWRALGVVTFWLSWPLQWVFLRSTKRTRLLLVCGDEFLAVRGWLGSGRWALPGGGLHRQEDPRQGTLRELLEETSVVLPASHLRFIYEKRFKECGLPIDYYCFFAATKDKPPIRPQWFEITDVEWVPIKNDRRFTKDAAAALAWWQKQK